ncbi:MAG: UDP-N-acetylglucosamine 1-carboxyvinyltransferase [Lachnospiraceae bacterium]|nr:UDP-N-acetylglucosamine 1-carboxyvinyltransferase [Lachnospiraceae bacterium]
MDTYKIYGGNTICGDIDIQGSKNAVLPLMAAALINRGTTILHNCPNISDVKNMAGILECFGCEIQYGNGDMVIDASGVSSGAVPAQMIKRVRASVLVMGAMIARTGCIELDYPGGCMIGARPVDYHIGALRQLGVDITENDGKICCRCDKMKGADIKLLFPSVGATENAVLAACGAEGITTIYNAAREPEVEELCEMLMDMGASIFGAGTSQITIIGKKEYHDVEHTVLSDRIAAGTYICAGIITGGRVCCLMNKPDILAGMTNLFKDMGCTVRYGNDYYEVKGGGRIRAIKYIETKPFPGFPTDMQSQFVSVLSKARGTSVIVENIFEARFQIAGELQKLGADISIDGNRAVIHGVEKLLGAKVRARELRGGAALIIAGLGAEGETVVEDKGYIRRGYVDVIDVLKKLGGNICCE